MPPYEVVPIRPPPTTHADDGGLHFRDQVRGYAANFDLGPLTPSWTISPRPRRSDHSLGLRWKPRQNLACGQKRGIATVPYRFGDQPVSSKALA